MSRTKFSSLLSLLVLTAGTLAAADAGWVVLFDGKSTDAWRAYRQEGFPKKGWEVVDGTLHVQGGGGAGDLVTRQKFGDFELEWEWKVSPGANSGVMYRVTEVGSEPWNTGPEYQILDDALHPDGKNPKTSAAALYALVAPDATKVLKPVGEWNASRIVLKGSKLEHWLNGKRVVALDLSSPEAKALIARSKFKDLPRFAQEPAGFICLQDHGNDVWYRAIRVRPL